MLDGVHRHMHAYSLVIILDLTKAKMEKQKLVLILLITIVLLLLFASVSLFYFNFNLIKQNKILGEAIEQKPAEAGLVTNPNPPKTEPQNQAIFVSDQKAIPRGISGIIDSIESDKITLQQFSSMEIKYQIEKSEVGKIVRIEKNPRFDKAKLQEIQKTMGDQPGLTPPKSKQEILSDPQVPEKVKQAIRDSSSSPTSEKEIGWNDLEKGMQVNVSTENDGKKKITVLPKDLMPPMPQNLVPSPTPTQEKK